MQALTELDAETRPAHRAACAEIPARVALAGQAAFVVAIVLGAVAQYRYSHLDQTISELAADDARHGWIMTAGFLAFGISVVALAIALGRSVRARTLLAVATLVVAGTLMPVVAFARLDCQTSSAACRDRVATEQVSAHQSVHDLASLPLFVAMATAPLLWARRFRRDPRWADLRRISIVAGTSTFALVVANVVVDGSRHWSGLLQRILLLFIVGWVCVAARRANRIAVDGSQQPA